MRSRGAVSIGVFAAGLLAGAAAPAQNVGGSLQGKVTDADGAGIPSAQVRNTATGATWTVSSDAILRKPSPMRWSLWQEAMAATHSQLFHRSDIIVLSLICVVVSVIAEIEKAAELAAIGGVINGFLIDPESNHSIGSAKLLGHYPAFQSHEQGTYYRKPDVTAPIGCSHCHPQFLQRGVLRIRLCLLMAQPPPYRKPFAIVQALFRKSFMRIASSIS